MNDEGCPFHAENWDIRIEDSEVGDRRITHYQPGVVSDAIKLFIDLRQEAQQAIYETCDILHEGSAKQVWWKFAFAEQIWKRFLLDNPVFDTNQVLTHFDAFPSSFFDQIHSVLKYSEYSKASYYEAEILKCKTLIGIPFSVNDIHAGWAAMVRETGIFGPFQERLNTISNELQEKCKDRTNIPLTAQSILGSWHNKMPPSHFVNSGYVDDRYILCPANQIVPLIGLNLSLNLALVHQNLYSARCHIPLLTNDDYSYRSEIDMLGDYEFYVYKN